MNHPLAEYQALVNMGNQWSDQWNLVEQVRGQRSDQWNPVEHLVKQVVPVESRGTPRGTGPTSELVFTRGAKGTPRGSKFTLASPK